MQAKVGDLLRVEWDVAASAENGVDVERGPFDGRVIFLNGRQAVVEFTYVGVRDSDRITIDLRHRTDLTNKAVIAGVTVLRRKKP